MSERLYELAVRHGELRARIAEQRLALGRHAAPVAAACEVIDRGRDGVDWLKQHPLAVAAGVLALVVARPKRALRWGQRGFLLWRGWQRLKRTLTPASH